METPTTRPGPETTRQLTRWLPAVTSATDDGDDDDDGGDDDEDGDDDDDDPSAPLSEPRGPGATTDARRSAVSRPSRSSLSPVPVAADGTSIVSSSDMLGGATAASSLVAWAVVAAVAAMTVVAVAVVLVAAVSVVDEAVAGASSVWVPSTVAPAPSPLSATSVALRHGGGGARCPPTHVAACGASQLPTAAVPTQHPFAVGPTPSCHVLQPPLAASVAVAAAAAAAAAAQHAAAHACRVVACGTRVRPWHCTADALTGKSSGPRHGAEGEGVSAAAPPATSDDPRLHVIAANSPYAPRALGSVA